MNFIFDPLSVDVILYHAKCSDGVGAAWPIWRENYYSMNKEIITKEVRHGSNHPKSSLIQGKNVVIVDFSYKRDVMLSLCSVAKSVVIIDHHTSAIEDLKDLENICPNYKGYFDVNRSGAQLSWDLVYPSKQRPWFVEIIADRDLWKWQIPNSLSIGKALFRKNWYTFEKMEEFYSMNEEETNKLIENLVKEGNDILSIEKSQIDHSCETAMICEFEGYRVKLATCRPSLRSEVGNKLIGDDCDFAAIWRYESESDQWIISLRGDGINPPNLTKLCEKYGGGGHPMACGFTIHGYSSKTLLNSNDKTKLAYGSIYDYFKV